MAEMADVGIPKEVANIGVLPIMTSLLTKMTSPQSPKNQRENLADQATLQNEDMSEEMSDIVITDDSFNIVDSFSINVNQPSIPSEAETPIENNQEPQLIQPNETSSSAGIGESEIRTVDSYQEPQTIQPNELIISARVGHVALTPGVESNQGSNSIQPNETRISTGVPAIPTSNLVPQPRQPDVTSMSTAAGESSKSGPGEGILGELSKRSFYQCCVGSCVFSTDAPRKFYFHLLNSHDKDDSFVCVHCGCVLKTAHALVHLHKHINIDKLSCNYPNCDFTANATIAYLRHLLSAHLHHTHNVCLKCGKEFDSIFKLVLHMKINSLTIFKCEFCPNIDVSKENLIRHYETSHPNHNKDSYQDMVGVRYLVCSERSTYGWPCLPTFRSSTVMTVVSPPQEKDGPESIDETVRRHDLEANALNSNESDKTDHSNQAVTVSESSITLPRVEPRSLNISSQKDLRTNMSDYVGASQNDKHSEKNSLDKPQPHITSGNVAVIYIDKTKQANKSMSEKTRSLEPVPHIPARQNNPPNQISSRPCVFLNRQTSSQIAQPPALLDSLQQNSFYQCCVGMCVFNTLYSTVFLHHLTSCHGYEGRFVCVHCGESLSTSINLMNHMHEHIVPHMKPCNYPNCNYCSMYITETIKHLQKCHVNEKNHVCFSCNERFDSVFSLSVHLNVQSITIFRCPFCTALENSKERIQRHIQFSHHAPVHHATNIVNMIAHNTICNERMRNNWPLVPHPSSASNKRSDPHAAAEALSRINRSLETSSTHCVQSSHSQCQLNKQNPITMITYNRGRPSNNIFQSFAKGQKVLVPPSMNNCQASRPQIVSNSIAQYNIQGQYHFHGHKVYVLPKPDQISMIANKERMDKQRNFRIYNRKYKKNQQQHQVNVEKSFTCPSVSCQETQTPVQDLTQGESVYLPEMLQHVQFSSVDRNMPSSNKKIDKMVKKLCPEIKSVSCPKPFEPESLVRRMMSRRLRVSIPRLEDRHPPMAQFMSNPGSTDSRNRVSSESSHGGNCDDKQKNDCCVIEHVDEGGYIDENVHDNGKCGAEDDDGKAGDDEKDDDGKAGDDEKYDDGKAGEDENDDDGKGDDDDNEEDDFVSDEEDGDGNEEDDATEAGEVKVPDFQLSPDREMKKSMVKVYLCRRCDYYTKYNMAWSNHSKKVHKIHEIYECSDCKAIVTEDEVVNHHEDNHNDDDESYVPVALCHTVRTVYINKRIFKEIKKKKQKILLPSDFFDEQNTKSINTDHIKVDYTDSESQDPSVYKRGRAERTKIDSRSSQHAQGIEGRGSDSRKRVHRADELFTRVIGGGDGQAVYKCLLCECTVTSLVSMEKHWKLHQPKVLCCPTPEKRKVPSI